jgi:regulator of sirC expression with transglutaminase-like and TPR domain
MSSQQDGLVKLLRDNDPDTVRLVKEQLAECGEEGLGQLYELCRFDDARVSAHAREVVAEIQGRSAVDDFSLICHFFGEGVNLEAACWALARAIEPGLCTTKFERKVNHWGRQFLIKIAGAVSNRERVKLLAEYLSGDLDFRGNSDDYYCERNSLLPRIIDARCGIPITLTMLYMMVGSRAAMKIEGINLPGHFLARHGEVFFDPFHRGRILTCGDIEKILAKQGLELTESHLQPASPRQIMVRMLANLLYVYDLTGDCEKHALVRGWVDSLVGGHPGE